MTDIDDYRDQLAAEHGIDDEHKDLLSASDPEHLRAQAEKVGALLGSRVPAFQSNPGQGRGGAPSDPDDVEYRRYYPNEGRNS